MLKVRFSRTGKVGQPSFRIVVAEHAKPVKSHYLEILGNYLPARSPKSVTINKERFSYWLSKGAKPTPAVASLLKKEGTAGMEKYIPQGTHKRSNKKQAEAAAAAPAPAAAPKTA